MSQCINCMFAWNLTPRPIVALAPMAGVTDASYRQFIKMLAPSVIVYTEFLSTDAIHFGSQRTLKMLHFNAKKERPFIVQIFGSDPAHFVSAAKVIENLGADGIDINMGCPAAKVVSSCHGSALIRNVDLASDLVFATKKAVSIPVSVKTRLGWNTTDTLITFCERLTEAGADAFAIHGRTYTQRFGGPADWEPIYELKRRLSVPVIGNGDIFSVDDALTKIKNLDGVMVGRGTFGNPWLMQDIADAFMHRQHGDTRARLSFGEKTPFILMHCELAVRMKGEQRGILEMRKHLASYVKGFEGASAMRERLMQVEKLKEVEAILKS